MKSLAVAMYADDEGYLPQYATGDSAGMDLRARIVAPLTICPGEAHTIATGVRVAIPKGYVGLVCPRSGLSSLGIRGGNSPGVIDPDYRGEVKAILMNTATQEFVIAPGDRIAQLLIIPCPPVEVIILPGKDAFDVTDRGERGFGSTGLS